MKYAETGFRALYHNFAVFPLTPVTGKALAGFEGAETAEGVLVYGYIDHEAGLTLEVLAPAGRDKEYWRFTDGNDEIRSFIRMEAVAEEEFSLINNEDGRLSARYAQKLEMLKVYDVSKEIEKSRTFGFLDGCRDSQYIDDVLVILTEDGLKPEACWARIIGLSEHRIRAKLLNEPDQDFTIHQGEDFAFYVHQDDETGEISCMAHFSRIEKISPEELADGKQLKTAIHQFIESNETDALIRILQILRDSDVWIPCNAVVGEEDQKTVEQMIAEAGDDLNSIIGKTFTSRQNIRMIPDILQKDGQYFFPVFAAEEDMGEYGQHFSKIQQSFMDALQMARNHKQYQDKIIGIVINAFTEPFILPKELYEAVEKMTSRLKK